MGEIADTDECISLKRFILLQSRGIRRSFDPNGEVESAATNFSQMSDAPVARPELKVQQPRWLSP